MYIDPSIIQWALISGASLCAFMIGREFAWRQRNNVVEDTIHYLIDEGFLKWKEQNGEIEIIRLDEDDETAR